MTKYLFLTLALLFSGLAKSEDTYEYSKEISSFEHDLRNLDRTKLAARADRAIGQIIKLAVWKLKRTGHHQEANRIRQEWEGQYKGFLVLNQGIGDYKPLSEWLAGVYMIAELLLGVETCEFLHLDDIKIINFTIPVVFAMHDVLGPVEIDRAEYGLHFNPFAGVVAYWGVWAGCTAATWGSGMFLICTPAGMGSEYLMLHQIAPMFAGSAYRFFWLP